MTTKRTPTGYVAVCQCGNIVGAMDRERTGAHEAGITLGRWLADGCTVEPRFAASWEVSIASCQCDQTDQSTA